MLLGAFLFAVVRTRCRLRAGVVGFDEALQIVLQHAARFG